MKILITGGCGFIGSNLGIFLKKNGHNVFSLDNLYRAGSKLNLKRLKAYKIYNYKTDINNFNKIMSLPAFNLIIDCCAEPSVEISRKSIKDAKRVFDTNLVGTFNIIQKCILEKTKIIFLSTSRVYSILSLKKLIKNLEINSKIKKNLLIDETFNTSQPNSLYGLTKLASEMLIREACYSNKLNYIINRLGVVAGPWQFGKTDQGFVSYWCWNYINKKNMHYIGFGGNGHQVRDILHINDLCEIILEQIKKFKKINNTIFNVSGGKKNAISLQEISSYLDTIFSSRIKFKKKKKTSIYDIPYYIGSNKKITKLYQWKPKRNIKVIINDIISWQKKNIKILKKYF